GGKANTTAREVTASADEGEGDGEHRASASANAAPHDKGGAKARSAAKDGKGAKAGAKDAEASAKDGGKGKDKAGEGAKGAKGAKEPAASVPAAAEGKPIPRRGDGVYGVTKRRGEGTFQLRDVPYIQYFENGYALHAAYWHDVFGTPRSHGCVNLAPVDAHRIFLWTDPPVPEGWHAVNTGEDMGEATTVIIHDSARRS